MDATPHTKRGNINVIFFPNATFKTVENFVSLATGAKNH